MGGASVKGLVQGMVQESRVVQGSRGGARVKGAIYKVHDLLHTTA
jgi:hypothetical protein